MPAQPFSAAHIYFFTGKCRNTECDKHHFLTTLLYMRIQPPCYYLFTGRLAAAQGPLALLFLGMRIDVANFDGNGVFLAREGHCSYDLHGHLVTCLPRMRSTCFSKPVQLRTVLAMSTQRTDSSSISVFSVATAGNGPADKGSRRTTGQSCSLKPAREYFCLLVSFLGTMASYECCADT